MVLSLFFPFFFCHVAALHFRTMLIGLFEKEGKQLPLTGHKSHVSVWKIEWLVHVEAPWTIGHAESYRCLAVTHTLNIAESSPGFFFCRLISRVGKWEIQHICCTPFVVSYTGRDDSVTTNPGEPPPPVN